MYFKRNKHCSLWEKMEKKCQFSYYRSHFKITLSNIKAQLKYFLGDLVHKVKCDELNNGCKKQK